MSEIERYDCEEDRSCEYEVKAVMQVDPNGYYVRHADHLIYLREMRMDRDVERLRADTAEADALSQYAKRAAAVEELSAAEQRIASHERMLRFFANLADVRQVGTAAIDYVAALNPNTEAESQGSTCNQIREENNLPINKPCKACNGGACIDR